MSYLEPGNGSGDFDQYFFRKLLRGSGNRTGNVLLDLQSDQNAALLLSGFTLGLLFIVFIGYALKEHKVRFVHSSVMAILAGLAQL